jgi:hypothetical protein
MFCFAVFAAMISVAVPDLAHGAQGTDEAQPAQPSSPAADQSASEDAPHWDLPVSLDRIRDELAQAPKESILRSLEVPADFRIRIEERRSTVDLLDGLDVKTAPAPPGGIYGYEQQRMLRNPVDHPLEQPYAAFSQGELLQVAATSVMTRALTNYLTAGATRASRARQERAAREEVRRAIAAYCKAQTDGSAVALCIATLRRD